MNFRIKSLLNRHAAYVSGSYGPALSVRKDPNAIDGLNVTEYPMTLQIPYNPKEDPAVSFYEDTHPNIFIEDVLNRAQSSAQELQSELQVFFPALSVEFEIPLIGHTVTVPAHKHGAEFGYLDLCRNLCFEFGLTSFNQREINTLEAKNGVTSVINFLHEAYQNGQYPDPEYFTRALNWALEMQTHAATDPLAQQCWLECGRNSGLITAADFDEAATYLKDFWRNGYLVKLYQNKYFYAQETSKALEF